MPTCSPLPDGAIGPPTAGLPPLRVVLAEDNALLREGIASLLTDAGHAVVGRAGDAAELLLQVRDREPDVAVIDVCMPPHYADDGVVAAAQIRRTHPAVAVLMLTQHVEPAYVLELLRDDPAGVGYLFKDRVRDVDEFLDVLRRVAAGDTALDPAVVSSLVGGRHRRLLDDLTPREGQVLELIAEGRSNRAIASRLFLSLRAVERDVQAIFDKLRLPTSADDNRRVLAVLAALGRSGRVGAPLRASS
jgi:DNA-binding NarL/FixJ family response regulator